MFNSLKEALDRDMLAFYQRIQDRKAPTVQKERLSVTQTSVVIERPQEDVQPPPTTERIGE